MGGASARDQFRKRSSAGGGIGEALAELVVIGVKGRAGKDEAEQDFFMLEK